MRRGGCHLAIDAVGAKTGGAAVVVLETLTAAGESPDVGRVTLYCSPRSDRSFALPVAHWLEVVERPREERSAGARFAWLAGCLAATARRDGADALLALNCARGGGLPTTALAQQSIPLSNEAMDRLTASERIRMSAIRALLWDSARHADRVAVQTPWMREGLISTLGATPERVVVVGTTSRHLSIGIASHCSTELEAARGNAALYVGSDGSHKNLRVLAPAMREVRSVRPRTQLFATLPVGHELGSPDIVCLGNLDDEALAASYSAAGVLVFPSLVESAGLPLVEAMSFGVPIVVADRSYAHDMCGDAAIYFDPHDPTALAHRIREVLDNGALQDRLREEGLARAQRFRVMRPYERLVELATSVAGNEREPFRTKS